MMLFKLSVKNIQKSIKDYAIYFFTLIVGVAIFYVFNSIETQTVLLDVTATTRELIKVMTNMLSGVSVFVSFVLGFLIIYASRFLMKRRNKEFAVYLVLGMGKRRISMILFIETLLIGIISLILGLVAGVFISQFMSAFVANMFEADMTRYEFVFSSEACIKTVIYFSIMYLIVMLFNTGIISKCKLIDMLQAGRRSEQIKMKNPIICIIVFIIAAVALGYAYFMVTVDFKNMQEADEIFVPIIIGCVSTFLIFWSLSGLILRIVTSLKGIYYKGLNSFTLRQVSSKVNTMVFSMTIICLMLFITICVLSSCISMKNSLTAELDSVAPADLQLRKQVEMDTNGIEDLDSKYIDSIELDILELYDLTGIDIKQYFKEYITFYTYETKEVTFEQTLGSYFEEVAANFRYLRYDTPETIIKLSDYNKLATLYGTQTYSLAENEYMVIADFDSMALIRNKVLELGEPLNIFGASLVPKYSECKEGFIEMSSSHVNGGIFIIPDSVANDDYIIYNNLVANYNTSSKKEINKIDDIVNSISEYAGEYMIPNGITKAAIVEASVGVGAMVVFIGIYIGIIFLISGAAIMALKELSESADNVERYRMLRKLGADEKLINRALFRQIGIFFLFPLILAIIHSVFGIKFCVIVMEVFGTSQLVNSVIMTGGILMAIYGGYFVLTYICSKNIIRER